jgi:hypothetical protein
MYLVLSNCFNRYSGVVRHTCEVCQDYDLCNNCFAVRSKFHDPNHCFRDVDSKTHAVNLKHLQNKMKDVMVCIVVLLYCCIVVFLFVVCCLLYCCIVVCCLFVVCFINFVSSGYGGSEIVDIGTAITNLQQRTHKISVV